MALNSGLLSEENENFAVSAARAVASLLKETEGAFMHYSRHGVRSSAYL